MVTSRITTLFAIVLGLTLFIGVAGAGQNDTSPTVAEVNGHKVTLLDLDKAENAQLLEARYQYYQAKRQALDDLINQYLLEDEAKREHLSIDQLLEKHAYKQIKDPTDEQLEVFYEFLDTKQPLSSIRDKILERIRQKRQEKARAAYIESLRVKETVTIWLAPPTAQVMVSGAPTRGPKDAPIKIIEFADYECPYCQKVNPELKKLEEAFTGKVQFIYMDLPLPMHAHAEKAAEAALCAHDQDKFWEFHDALFNNPTQLDVPHLKQQAVALKLDEARFNKCLDSGEKSATVQKNLAEARRLGLTGTPSFFINNHFLGGAVGYDALHDLVQQQLNPAPDHATTTARSNG